MKTAIQRWGNSLALRIPKAFAEQAKMRKGTAVNLTLDKGRLVVAPFPKQELSLKQLVAKVTAENIHSETDWGAPVGRETW
jgi:antitoxin MazE